MVNGKSESSKSEILLKKFPTFALDGNQVRWTMENGRGLLKKSWHSERRCPEKVMVKEAHPPAPLWLYNCTASWQLKKNTQV